MMDKVKMMADAYRLRQAIEALIIEFEENGIKITIGGDLQIKKISLNNVEHNVLKDAINKAIRKAQESQVLKMKEMTDLQGISQDNS